METLSLTHRDIGDENLEICLSEHVIFDKSYRLVDLSFNRLTVKSLETVVKFMSDHPNVRIRA